MRKSVVSSASGFTLIELSVVLVVIGLIIGSVLVGSSILQNARVTQTVSALQAIQSAVSTYNQNYSALPGDDAQTTAHFPSAGIPVGGGNGAIGVAGSFNVTTAPQNGSDTGGESGTVWQCLRAAGLVKSNGPQQWVPPSNPFGGIIGIQNSAFTTNGITNANVVCASSVPGAAARAIDQRLDDGNGTTGNMRAGVTATSVGGPASDYTDANTYTLCTTL